MFRSTILAAAHNRLVERAVKQAPLSRELVQRFVGGSDVEAVVPVATRLLNAGLAVSLDHLGEHTTDRAGASAAADAYLGLLSNLHRRGLPELLGPLNARVDVSVKLSAIGQALPGDGVAIALENARRICTAAGVVDATVTLDAEDHTTTDATLATLLELRKDFPSVAAVVQTYLRRSEADCRDLAGAGSRVRLCKGAYDEPSSVAFDNRDEVDRSYVRCLNALLGGAGYPMVATHDPRLIAIALDRAGFYDRSADEFEFQMLYGIRPQEQVRLSELGHTVRVYVPYGEQWYPYLMRRLAERPANVSFLLRSLISKD
jgi:proline dehydrogenase